MPRRSSRSASVSGTGRFEPSRAHSSRVKETYGEIPATSAALVDIDSRVRGPAPSADGRPAVSMGCKVRARWSATLPGGAARVQKRRTDVVLPASVDAKVIAGVALDDEAEAPQHPPASAVVRHVVRLDSVQAELPEGIVDRHTQGFRHQALPLEALVYAVTEGAVLPDPADEVREADVPDHPLRLRSREDEEAESTVEPVILIVLPNLPDPEALQV